MPSPLRSSEQHAAGGVVITLILIALVCLALMLAPFVLMIVGALLPYVLAFMAVMWLFHACC